MGREGSMHPTELRALTFDCYGTLIDWETGILSVLRAWADHDAVAPSDEELLASFARAESRCEQARPFRLYPDILRAAHAEIAREFGRPPDSQAAEALARSVGDWLPFPDTVAALTRLRERFRLVIVSNVDRASLARTERLLGVDFDAVVTAEEVGAYKPDPRMFRRALEIVKTLSVDPRELLHVAQSLYHDHVPAQALGLQTVWVDRRRGRPGSGATLGPETEVTPDWTVQSLEELSRLLLPGRSGR